MAVFLIITSILLFISILCPLTVFLIVRLSSIYYNTNCFEVFKNQGILQEKFPLVLKLHWYKHLTVYGFFLVFFIGISFTFYLALDFVSYSEDKVKTVYVFIVIIGGILLYVIISFFCCKKTWKEMSKLGIRNHKIALTLFTNYQDEFVKPLAMPTIKEFELFNDQNLRAMIDSPFQFNQRRFKRKVQRLKKRLNGKFEEKYQYQLLKIYIIYLKTYAVFFKRIQKLNKASVCVGDYIGTTHFFVDGKRYEDFEVLKAVLISNFFAFAN